MSKHTPGPWGLNSVPTSVGACHKIGPFPNGPYRNETFACVYADGHRLGIDDANDAAVELLANARLIAAAPELLEALEKIAGLRKPQFFNPDDMAAEAVNIARAAIAKATGVTA